MLHTIINPEEIFYKAENKKSSELVCITDPYEYIRNDEYSNACNKLKAYERGKNEYNRRNNSGIDSGGY